MHAKVDNITSFVTARSDGDHPGLSGRGAATIRALVRPAGAVDVGVIQTFYLSRQVDKFTPK